MTDDRTPDMDDPTVNDPDVVAAELVLGLLEGEERTAAHRRLLADPAFAARVEQWRAHFGVLFDGAPAVIAPANGLSRLMQRLGGSANDNRAPVRLWQAVAGLSSLAAAALLILIVTQPKPESTPIAAVDQRAPQQLLVTQIVASGDAIPVAAVFDPASGALRIAPAMLVDARHSAELWVIAADGVPHSLGVLASGKPATVAIHGTDRGRFVAGSVLAVTIEPLGGSPMASRPGRSSQKVLFLSFDDASAGAVHPLLRRTPKGVLRQENHHEERLSRINCRCRHRPQQRIADR